MAECTSIHRRSCSSTQYSLLILSLPFAPSLIYTFKWWTAFYQYRNGLYHIGKARVDDRLPLLPLALWPKWFSRFWNSINMKRSPFLWCCCFIILHFLTPSPSPTTSTTSATFKRTPKRTEHRHVGFTWVISIDLTLLTYACCPTNLYLSIVAFKIPKRTSKHLTLIKMYRGFLGTLGAIFSFVFCLWCLDAGDGTYY